MTLDDALAKFIEEQRIERQWTQADLAKKLGMTQSTLSRWLGGKRRTRSLQWYADISQRAFGIPLSLMVSALERRQDREAMEQEVALLRADLDELLKQRLLNHAPPPPLLRSKRVRR
jgi:transcriptional regulator with XRE-family HTH domain